MIVACAFMIICRHLQNSTKQAIKRALQLFERTDNFIIQDAVFHRYRWCHDLSILSAWLEIFPQFWKPYYGRVQLTAHPTTIQGTSKKSECRDGFIFRICLDSGVYGYGEVIALEFYFLLVWHNSSLSDWIFD